MERLDLVQFHWWDYTVPGAVETALMLKELQQEGKIDRIGGTNFDTAHTRASSMRGCPWSRCRCNTLSSTRVQRPGSPRYARNAA